MRYVFLTQQFYDDFVHCIEIERKISRPYAQVIIEMNGIIFAVPLRSNIKHNHVLWSDKENRCGLDFSKTVVITRTEYIDINTTPRLRQVEFETLKGKDHIAKQKLQTYIKHYKRAKKFPEFEYNRRLCQYSTLQYFEEYI